MIVVSVLNVNYREENPVVGYFRIGVVAGKCIAMTGVFVETPCAVGAGELLVVVDIEDDAFLEFLISRLDIIGFTLRLAEGDVI